MIVNKTFTFEASHMLPKHPGKCAQLHGHSWQLTVAVEGSVDSETGFVIDYGELKKLVQEHIIDLVDHQHLGQGDVTVHLPGGESTTIKAAFGLDFYPSSENLLHLFRQRLFRVLPRNVMVHHLSLRETDTSEAVIYY